MCTVEREREFFSAVSLLKNSLTSNRMNQSKAEVFELFSLFSVNVEGSRIKLTDLETVLKCLGVFGPLGSFTAYKKADTTGEISFRRFYKLLDAQSKVPVERQLKEAFQYFDYEKNGIMPLEQLKTILLAATDKLDDVEQGRIQEILEKGEYLNAKGDIDYCAVAMSVKHTVPVKEARARARLGAMNEYKHDTKSSSRKEATAVCGNEAKKAANPHKNVEADIYHTFTSRPKYDHNDHHVVNDDARATSIHISVDTHKPNDHDSEECFATMGGVHDYQDSFCVNCGISRY